MCVLVESEIDAIESFQTSGALALALPALVARPDDREVPEEGERYVRYRPGARLLNTSAGWATSASVDAGGRGRCASSAALRSANVVDVFASFGVA